MKIFAEKADFLGIVVESKCPSVRVDNVFCKNKTAQKNGRGQAQIFPRCIQWQQRIGGIVMAEISLCMIVRDEEAVLGRCLDSIADLVEEIVLVDTGSRDRTKEIARAYGAEVYDFTWIDDFSAARNFAFSKATKEYLFWMDADDILPESQRAGFAALKAMLADAPCDTVMLLYDAAFDETGKPTFSYYRERLLRRSPLARWQGAVHEVIEPFGRIRYEAIHIEHRKEGEGAGDRNLRIYEKQIAAGKTLEPRAQFYYGRELFFHGKYERAAEVFRQFLREPAAWLENRLEAVRFLAYSLEETGRAAEAFDALLAGLRLAPPTGELCCDLGRYFFARGEWEQAAFWYETALRAEKRTERGAFVQEECYGYLPCVQLCACWLRLGDTARAKRYNDMAGVFRPNDPKVAQNRQYFMEG